MILKSGHVTHCGASIRVGQWKLMLGYPGWPDLAFPLPTSTTPNVTEPRLDPTDPAVWNSLKCSEGCLFNLETVGLPTLFVDHCAPLPVAAAPHH